MKTQEINYITHCLKGVNKNLFYFKDKYALDLLSAVFKSGTNIGEIRKSRFDKLLNKQLIKSILSTCGNGQWNHTDPVEYIDEKTQYFNYDLGTWGKESKWRKDGYFQVSRPEKNLVFQVLFGSGHDYDFNRILGQNLRDHFSYDFHPIHKKKNTLGWVRMDIDLDNGEVLIEEIQNDWFRLVKSMERSFIEMANGRMEESSTFNEIGLKRLRNYIKVIRPTMKIWDEILMGLALNFIIDELGIRTIWYHSFETGNYFKELSSYSTKPPKSLYKSLPEKFCFELNKAGPKMLRECKYLKKYFRKRTYNEWYLLEL